MPVISDNYSWMSYNIFLALIAVFLGICYLYAKNNVIKFTFGIPWIMFLPNTIYIFTDLVHVIQQWSSVHGSLRYLLISQYFFFELAGLATFLLAIFPFEMLMIQWHIKRRDQTLAIILFNTLIAFGMVLGRVERINSWEVVTSPLRVIDSAVSVIFSYNLLGLTLLFALFCNFVYFLFRDPIRRRTDRVFKLLD
jgi:uncharacterized membrane protein